MSRRKATELTMPNQRLLFQTFEMILIRALSQTAKDDENMRKSSQNDYKENIDQSNTTAPTHHAGPHESTTKGREGHELTHCTYRSWCEICVGAKWSDGQRRRQNVDNEKISVFEFDFTSGTDRSGDLVRKVANMAVAASVKKKSCTRLMTRHKGGRDEYLVQGILNYTDLLVTTVLKCDPESS